MRVIVLSAAFAAVCLPTWAGDDVDAADIIRKFAAKELEFQQARNNYTYRQSGGENDYAHFSPKSRDGFTCPIVSSRW